MEIALFLIRKYGNFDEILKLNKEAWKMSKVGGASFKNKNTTFVLLKKHCDLDVWMNQLRKIIDLGANNVFRLPEGASFGEMALIQKDSKRKATVKVTEENTVMAVLNRS